MLLVRSLRRQAQRPPLLALELESHLLCSEKVCSFFLQALQAAAWASKSEDTGVAQERVADVAEVRRRGRT